MNNSFDVMAFMYTIAKHVEHADRLTPARPRLKHLC